MAMAFGPPRSEQSANEDRSTTTLSTALVGALVDLPKATCVLSLPGPLGEEERQSRPGPGDSACSKVNFNTGIFSYQSLNVDAPHKSSGSSRVADSVVVLHTKSLRASPGTPGLQDASIVRLPVDQIGCGSGSDAMSAATRGRLITYY